MLRLYRKVYKRGGLVDLIGIEPMTSSMPWKRAPSCATGPLLSILGERWHLSQTVVLGANSNGSENG